MTSFPFARVASVAVVALGFAAAPASAQEEAPAPAAPAAVDILRAAVAAERCLGIDLTAEQVGTITEMAQRAEGEDASIFDTMRAWREARADIATYGCESETAQGAAELFESAVRPELG